MATSGGRGGRRRWMLHEDVRSGVAAIEEESSTGPGSGAARRYSFDACSVSFSVASRLLPQRLLAVWGLLVAGVALITGLTILEIRSEEICRSLGIADLPAADWSSASSLGSWLSSAFLWVSTLLCLLIYGLRRHRLDDYRGSYRRWLGAAGACALANLVLTTGLHHSVSEALAAASGFTALPGHAVWWLLPTAIAGTWVVVRIALDMRPCRLGLVSLAMACGLYVAALMASFGILPSTVGEYFYAPVAICAGHLWLAIALLAQIRFIILEATGQIAPARVSEAGSAEGPSIEVKSAKAPQKSSWKQPAISAEQIPSVSANSQDTETRRTGKKSLIAASKGRTEWIDGRDTRDSDQADDEDERPLSKADRKRLRKEQARRRAA